MDFTSASSLLISPSPIVFNSVRFLVFFPIVVAGFFALPHRARWLWLLAASLGFYGLGQPLLLAQMLVAAAVTYGLGIKIEGAATKPRKKALMRLGVALLVANLAVFKYTGFVNETVRSMAGWLGATYPLPVVHLLLPIGISFYTFLLIGYLIDVSNGLAAERHFGVFALYVSFFPKLVAGPIERAKNLLPQLHRPQTFDYTQAVGGLVLMALGFFKKLVVGDRLAPFVNEVYDAPAGARRRDAGGGDLDVRVPGLLRLQRVLRHRDRRRARDGLPAGQQLQPPVLRDLDRRLLEALAHLAVDLADRLPVHAAHPVEGDQAQAGTT